MGLLVSLIHGAMSLHGSSDDHKSWTSWFLVACLPSYLIFSFKWLDLEVLSSVGLSRLRFVNSLDWLGILTFEVCFLFDSGAL